MPVLLLLNRTLIGGLSILASTKYFQEIAGGAALMQGTCGHMSWVACVECNKSRGNGRRHGVLSRYPVYLAYRRKYFLEIWRISSFVDDTELPWLSLIMRVGFTDRPRKFLH